ncbi:MAG: RNA polymerase factor sigma-54 [Terriglobales bacterium]|jgi:RNA polymerase sigma-54 factor
MVLLQHRLNVKLSQRQILTPGLVQMVSVLALNKLELKDMINAEMVENPVLEELEDAIPLLDDVGRQEEERDRLAAKATSEEATPVADEKKDPFEEIDFGSFFQEYLDPGYRSSGEMEEIEKPSFENFLSKPGNLSDHLLWQLGAISLRPPVLQAAQLIIGNLNEEGYLIASDEELLGIAPVAAPEADVEAAAKIVGEAAALGLVADSEHSDLLDADVHGADLANSDLLISDLSSSDSGSELAGADLADSELAHSDLITPARGASVSAPDDLAAFSRLASEESTTPFAGLSGSANREFEFGGREEVAVGTDTPVASSAGVDHGEVAPIPAAQSANHSGNTSTGAATARARIPDVTFTLGDLHEALEVVRQFDPQGIACRDLRECLLNQLRYHLGQLHLHSNGSAEAVALSEQVVKDAIAVVDQHLRAVTLKQFKEIARAIGRPVEAVQAALDYVRTLDPRPGLRYNKVPARLIEPDVAFVKHGDEWLVIMNDEDMPQLRLNPAYKRLLTRDGNDRDTRNYVKDRYKSAIQLIKNIEQRKQTIAKVCYSIVARQQDFLDLGIDQLKPMMIKEVAEEIGVHPSTVSRAVANKYVHTPQGVFELRYFFSESVQGPEGGGTSLLILKRRVKKLIEDEDPSRPLTDEQITRILQSQGIQVTRRTVAKYREDMKIPSTHQRRVKK